VEVWFAVVFALVGFVFLWKGADFLVEGSSRLAIIAKLSPIVIGITIVAFGTSLPEMAVSLAASVKGEPGITLGNVVGSNIANILLVLGVAAIIRPLEVTRHIVTRDSMLVTGAGVVLFLLALTGHLTRIHGLIMLGFFACYLAYYIRDALRHERPSIPDITDARSSIAIGMTIIGIAGILIGSNILVDSAVTLAEAFGISPAVIGLSMIAIGTSLPELATSAMASKKGKSDLSIGNVLGSNVFNILLVLGISVLIVANGIEVNSAMIWDIILMTFVCLCLVPTLWTNLKLTRTEGVLMLIAYVVYISSLAFRQGMI
jgi:cation:H+ antiporter